MRAKRGQLIELPYEGKVFDVIVIDPDGLGKNQPSVGFGFNMMERHGGLPNSTSDNWLEGVPNASDECLKVPSGNRFRVSRIWGEDNIVLENSDITDKDELLKTDLEEKSALLSSIQNELPTEQDTQEPFQIEASQTETVSADIDIKLLALRLGMKNSQSITNKKSQLSEEEFFWWTTSKDIDRIGWKPKKVGKQVYYKPIVLNEDSELLSKLLKWIKKNKVS